MYTCEKCAATKKREAGIFDYCAKCGKYLCGDCMAKGHCGTTPARSGAAEDEESVDKMSQKLWEKLHA